MMRRAHHFANIAIITTLVFGAATVTGLGLSSYGKVIVRHVELGQIAFPSDDPATPILEPHEVRLYVGKGHVGFAFQFGALVDREEFFRFRSWGFGIVVGEVGQYKAYRGKLAKRFSDVRQSSRQYPIRVVIHANMQSWVLALVLLAYPIFVLAMNQLRRPCVERNTRTRISAAIAASVGVLAFVMSFLVSGVAAFAILSFIVSTKRIDHTPTWVTLNLIGLGVSVVVGVVVYRKLTRPLPGECTQCGYDLTGNESGICPECGGRV